LGRRFGVGLSGSLVKMRTDLTSADWRGAVELLNELYGTIEGPGEPFAGFLDGLSNLFETGPASLLTYNRQTNAPAGHTVGADPKAMAAHEEYYFRISPWFQPEAAVTRFFSGQVVSYEEAVPLQEYVKTEYFHDWGRPNGIVHGIGTAVQSNADLCTFISLNRPLTAEPFGLGDVELLQALVPHVARAVRLRAQAKLGQPAAAAFLVTPQLRLLLANPAAEALLTAKGGFRLRGGCLRTPYEGDQSELRRIVGAVREMGTSSEEAWTARLRGAEPESWYLVQASPSGLGLEQVVLTVRSLRPPGELVPGRLRAVLRLTPAEVRLVCSLWRTANLVTSASNLEISINTAKRQLQNVFSKTGTSNQPSLFKLLAALHPVE